MTGNVNDRLEAVIRVSLYGPSGINLEIDAIIDTGFTGGLAVPLSIVESLGLARRALSSAVLADGSTKVFDMYSVELDWDGSLKDILLSALGNEPLVGMQLLRNRELKIEVKAGGAVSVDQLI